MEQGQSLVGLFLLTVLAWLVSENRRAFPWKLVVGGIALQFALAVPLLYLPASRQFFLLLNEGVLAIQEATQAGTSFVFGYLGGGKLPFVETTPGGSFILALQALPLVLVFSAISSLLFYWRVLPWIIRGISTLLEKGMGIGGAVGLSTAMNIFVGMVEAPLFIRPYLLNMSRAELFAVMVGGMASIAGTVMALYAIFLAKVIPDAMGHLLIASIMSAPAALTIAFIMIPQQAHSTAGRLLPPTTATSTMDAISLGVRDGVQLLIQIIAMLLVYVALVSLANSLLSLFPQIAGEAITLQRILGWLAAPLTWLMGIPWQEAHTAGALMGTKTILNEFIAYLNMSQLPAEALSPRSRLILTYGLCGFANLGSLGIMIGGMGEMVPERRQEIVALGMRSILAGTLATCMTGAVVGVLI
ncbi:MAG: nucleoside:proton symporter [Magnetococcales bacterium]|nr:nucleoside:proton symporter [Magnetococcales bacterium]NGZ27964.1 nucleoside:proton symporter [Magnetococcales bacterium]